MASTDETTCFNGEANAFLGRIQDAVQRGTGDIQSIRNDLLRRTHETSSIVVAFAYVVKQKWGNQSGPLWKELFRMAEVEQQQQKRSTNRNERLKLTHLAIIKVYWPSPVVEGYRFDELGNTRMQYLCHCAKKWNTWLEMVPPARLVLWLRLCRAVTSSRSEPLPPDQPRPHPHTKDLLVSPLDLTVQDLKAMAGLSEKRQRVYGRHVTSFSATELSEEIQAWTTNVDGTLKVNGYRLCDWRPTDWRDFLLKTDDHGLLRQRRADEGPDSADSPSTPPASGIMSPPPSTPPARTRTQRRVASNPMLSPSRAPTIHVGRRPAADESEDEDIPSTAGVSSAWRSDRSTVVGAPSPKVLPDVVAADGHGWAYEGPNNVDAISIGSTPIVSPSPTAITSGGREGAADEAAEGDEGFRHAIEEAERPTTRAHQTSSVGDAGNDHDSGSAPISNSAPPSEGDESIPSTHDIRSTPPANTLVSHSTSEAGVPFRARSGTVVMAENAPVANDPEEVESMSSWDDDDSDESDSAVSDDSSDTDGGVLGDISAAPQTRLGSFSPHTPSVYSDDPVAERPAPASYTSPMMSRPPTLRPPTDMSSGTLAGARNQRGDRIAGEHEIRSMLNLVSSRVAGFESDDDGRDSEGDSDESDELLMTPPFVSRPFTRLMTPPFVPRSFTPLTPSLCSDDSFDGVFEGVSTWPGPSHRPKRTADSGANLRLPRAVHRPTIHGDEGGVSTASTALQQALSEASIWPAPVACPEPDSLFVSAGSEYPQPHAELLGGGLPSARSSDRGLRIDVPRSLLDPRLAWSTTNVPSAPNMSTLNIPMTDEAACSGMPFNPVVSSNDSRGPVALHQPSHVEYERHLQAAEDAASAPQANDVCLHRRHWLSHARSATIGTPAAAASGTGYMTMTSADDVDISALSPRAFIVAAQDGVVFSKPVLIQGGQVDRDAHSLESLARGMRERFGPTTTQVRRARESAAETMRVDDLVDLLLSDAEPVTSLDLRDRVRAQMPAMSYLHRFDLLDVAMTNGLESALPVGSRRARPLSDVRSLTLNHITTSGAFQGPHIRVGGACLRVLEGRMMIIYITRDEMAGQWEAFGQDHSGWRPRDGVRKKIMLQRDDQLFLPAGTVSAAYTIEAGVSLEVPVWDRHDLLPTLRSALWITRHPRCVSGWSMDELPGAIDGLESLVQRDIDQFARSWPREAWQARFAEYVQSLRQEIRARGEVAGGAPQRRTASSPPSVGASGTQRSPGRDKRRRLA